MSEREKIQQTIATLESQRAVLGDEVVDASIQALQEKLDKLPPAGNVGRSINSGTVMAKRDAIGGDQYNFYINEEQAEEAALQNIDPTTATGQYIAYLIKHNRYLHWYGVSSKGPDVNMPLDTMYITLRATPKHMLAQEEIGQTRQKLGDDLTERLSQLEDMREEIPDWLTIHEALSQHKRLVVLGDPGSGKTTLLRYLTLIYARELAGEDGLVNNTLKVAEEGYIPLNLPLRNLASFLQRHSDDSVEGHRVLLRFCLEQLKNDGVLLNLDFFVDHLNKGRAVILLDGLDEVSEDVRGRVSRLVDKLTLAYPLCRYVVTSRIVGYNEAVALRADYERTTVREFTLADMRLFLRRWHQLVAIHKLGKGLSADKRAERKTEELVAAIEKNERIRELAINPLMLTVIALVHEEQRLPNRRAELYQEAVKVLLRQRDSILGISAEEAILENRVFDHDDKRLLLQNLALYMQERGIQRLEADALRRFLHQLFYQRVNDNRVAERATNRFLQFIQERTGLLVEQGKGVYAFSHLTFQEYLAALAIVARDDYVSYVLRWCAHDTWREVVLLTVGQLSMGGAERTSHLVEALADNPNNSLQSLTLAAECLRDAGQGRFPRVEQKVIGRLQEGLQKPAPWFSRWRKNVNLEDWIRQRSLAATALGRLEGYYWDMPYGEPEWVTIPAGKFWMGSEDGKGNEKPRHQVTLPTYQIARVPVTNAQYLLFVQATNHNPPYHWQDGHIPKGLESHPVTWVTWHDSMAYCAWLSEVTGKQITLPSEAQWEKAARWTDGRIYPWGNTFDRLKCNSKELGIQITTPVGIFPEGASPEGVLDMSGNVFEWTRTRWGRSYPYQAEDGRENLEVDEDTIFVLRGGSWYTDKNWMRCSFRRRLDPGYGYFDHGIRVIVVASPFPVSKAES